MIPAIFGALLLLTFICGLSSRDLYKDDAELLRKDKKIK